MPDRRHAIQSALDDAHASVLAAIDQLSDPDAPMPGYDGWTKKDLISHLISIESRLRGQIECAVRGAAWTPEDVDTFNAREVAARSTFTLDELRHEFDEQTALSRTLLGSLREADLATPFEHPRRGRISVDDLWAIIPGHTTQHVADLERASLRPSVRP